MAAAVSTSAVEVCDASLLHIIVSLNILASEAVNVVQDSLTHLE